MRVAIIDLGTNSVRFDVHQLRFKKGSGKVSKKKASKKASKKTPRRAVDVQELHREKLMVRLGQGVFSDGRLNADAIRRTLNAFVSFERTARELRADRIVAFGTAALREAADGDRLLDAIRMKTGIEIRVISGAEEAKLIALGVLRNEKLPKGRFGLIDIGGGSTEISICRGRELVTGDSFPVGTARLQQVFLRSSPPRARPGQEDPIVTLRRYLRSSLLPKMIGEDWPRVNRLLGSSGTVRALIRLIRAGKVGKATKDRSISRESLRKLVRRMSTLTTTELLALPGMEAKRVDMILAGAILLEECMIATGAKRISATEYSLRDGILEEQIDLFQREKVSSIGLRLEDLKERIAPYYSSTRHFDQVATLAGQLFDLTQQVHRLDSSWKEYLQAAAILHDIGEIISPSNHEEHSYYFVRNMDSFVTENWEAEFLAQLCRWHRTGKPNPPSFGKENAEKRKAFFKLLSLLRLSDALDRGHQSQLKVRKARVTLSEVELTVTCSTTPDLELLRVEQKKGLFEDVFRKRLRVVYRRSA